MRTAEQIRAQISSLEAELSTVAGEPLLIWTGREGDIVDCPEGGATLTVEWAVQEYSYCNWYPTTEAAKAALLAVARENSTMPSEDGLRVDLTSPGCHSSRAYVTRLGSSSPSMPLRATVVGEDLKNLVGTLCHVIEFSGQEARRFAKRAGEYMGQGKENDAKAWARRDREEWEKVTESLKRLEDLALIPLKSTN